MIESTSLQEPGVPGNLPKPRKIQILAVLTLVSGIANLLWMLGCTLWIILPLGFSSFGLGCLLLLVVIPPTVLGLFEIVYASRLLPGEFHGVKPSPTVAVLEILCILTVNIIPVLVGIAALFIYSDPKVKAYFSAGIPGPAASS